MHVLHSDARFAQALLSDEMLLSDEALLSADALPPGLAAKGGAPVARRFAIHRNTVSVTLTEALSVAFPVVRALVGEDFFAAAARAFIAKAPPQSPVLADYGADFADFLAAFPPVAELPYLPDMARLERLMLEAYHAADAPAATRSTLAGQSPANAAGIPLARHPAARWLCSPWPVVTLWRMNRGLLPLGPLLSWHGEKALITRPELDVTLAPLSEGGEQVLSRLARPVSLGALAEAMEPHGGLATALPPLLDAGALCCAGSLSGDAS